MNKIYQEETKYLPQRGYMIFQGTCNFVKPLIKYNSVCLSAKWVVINVHVIDGQNL